MLQHVYSGYLQFDDFKAFVVLLGGLGVEPEFAEHQKATLGRLFDWLDTDGDRQIVRHYLTVCFPLYIA